MTIYEAQQRLLFQLYHIYDNREAANITDLVMEHITGWKKIDRILHKHVPLLPGKIDLLEKYITDLLNQKPVQYVLHEAWFYGMKLFVDENVLIPRPETEELVDWIVKTIRFEKLSKEQEKNPLIIFDIGTGSGCIPIAIKKHVPIADVYACDLSKEALAVAHQNATAKETDIGFLQLNFLDPAQWEHLPSFDIVVSNPPYIPLKDKATMRENVVLFEPPIALFVDDNNPLIFYDTIANFARQKLNYRGSIFLEINEAFANDIEQLFNKKGFTRIEMKKDMQGKDRMVRVSM
jgi:release factor glutamine methyltransferase